MTVAVTESRGWLVIVEAIRAAMVVRSSVPSNGMGNEGAALKSLSNSKVMIEGWSGE